MQTKLQGGAATPTGAGAEKRASWPSVDANVEPRELSFADCGVHVSTSSLGDQFSIICSRCGTADANTPLCAAPRNAGANPAT